MYIYIYIDIYIYTHIHIILPAGIPIAKFADTGYLHVLPDFGVQLISWSYIPAGPAAQFSPFSIFRHWNMGQYDLSKIITKHQLDRYHGLVNKC